MNPVRSLVRSAIGIRATSGDVSFDDWVGLWDPLNGNILSQTLIGGNTELADGTFTSLAQIAYRRNGTAFACMLVRMMIFAEARFAFQQMRGGSGAELFGTPDLGLIEHPWTNATTGDLLSRAMLDIDLAGNFYAVRRARGRGLPDQIKRLRPDWVHIVLGTQDQRDDFIPGDPDVEIAGYAYFPGGIISGNDPITFLPDEVMHFAPVPDPLFSFRGMSWLTPITTNVAADTAATVHKRKFFDNGATPNMVVSLNIDDLDKFRDWVKEFEKKNVGLRNAYKTLFLGAGSSATVVGTNMRQMDFASSQGMDRDAIITAAGLHPVLVPIGKGGEGAGLNGRDIAGIRRHVADTTFWPLWRNFAGSLETLLPAPRPGTRLWITAGDIAFLAEDVKDKADILSTQAQSIRTLTDGGFRAQTVVEGAVAGDWSRLEHTGYLPVQVQPIQGDEGALPAAAYAHIGAGNERPRLLLHAGREVESLADFWPLSGLYRDAGRLPTGTRLPNDHPLVAEFPAMFAAIDAPKQITAGLRDVRCSSCGKLVGRASGQVEIKCKCGTLVAA